jgi:mannose-6-phosphate isomerase-like protein (cupin superfamily)
MSNEVAKQNAGQGLDPDFPKGRLHVSKADSSGWVVGLRDNFEYRDLGIAEATSGKVLAHVIRARRTCAGAGDTHYHKLDFQMVYVLKGWMEVGFGERPPERFTAGDCWYQEPGIHHTVTAYADDLEVIEITVPADFETVSV